MVHARKFDVACQPEMVPLSKLAPAAYNPRETDPQRIVHLRTSLGKLGFVLPLYATPDGHLLSGHQRLLVATELGCKAVPVIRVELPERRLKKANLLFNRTTNDMAKTDTSENLLARLTLLDIGRVTTAVETKDPNSAEMFPCMRPEYRPIAELVKSLPDEPYDPAAVQICTKFLDRSYDVVMPIVMSESGRIVNGKYRLLAAAENASELQITDWPTVVIPDTDAELATLLMNMVSMSFTVEKQYADTLRYGGFRRASNVVEELVAGVRFFADGHKFKSPQHSFANPPVFWQKWRAEHGKSFLDLGAGQRRNEIILQAKGVRCRSWEPYPTPWEHPTSYGPKDVTDDPKTLKTGWPNLTLARLLTRDFLAEVEAGVKWDSVFANAVLNSVPFHEDRVAFLAVAHACTAFGSAFYGTARSIERKIKERGRGYDPVSARQGMFELPYEQDIIIGEITTMPKVQKFHSEASLRPLLSSFFGKVDVYPTNGYIAFKGSAPKRVDASMLAWAIRKQFDLPYPEDNASIGMAEQALDAFSKRLRIDLRAAPSFKGAPLEAAS